ncbi:acyl transferase domain-containing protein/acyl carrier protein [Rhodoligotrophos appendicifer]|uniref:type I polyketide synthase n=1 Tax=Rhodoligotrophos appendicifer TaxID=987056 RepID=UPI0011864805|nr:type I polyketide synthase [Rhodoligotrophos appendicifer]
MNKFEQLDQQLTLSNIYAETIPVAVVGVGIRFPGGVNSGSAYWSFLRDKKSGIVEVPEERWNLDAFYDADPDAIGKTRSRWGGFLEDVFSFDPTFFDLSPRETAAMDPQQRLLLQVAYEAMQDGGTTMREAQRLRTGVFVGISTTDFSYSQKYRRNHSDIFAGTGAAMSIAANRISHRFDLSGPSMAIDTACSSALVAVDQAVRHLSMGTCDMALAGGVNCMLDPGVFIAFTKANMLSLTGEIYTFDERANGFVRGEGCGLVLLKPLTKAVADQDRIYGVIRGTCVNQDGRTPTLTAPSREAQTAMLANLVDVTGTDPRDVGYLEAHGTGTPVGDPIEAHSIGNVFGRDRTDTPILVGSVKPNIGHLESASGVASLVKVLLSIRNGMVLPNRNFERPNPHIPFDALGIAVPQELQPFPEARGSRLAAINSFGFGGTNASVMIESWSGSSAPLRSLSPVALDSNPWPVMMPVSASSKAMLSTWAFDLAAAIESGELADEPVSHIVEEMARNRDHLAERAVVITRDDRASLCEGLTALARGGDSIAAVAATGTTIITGHAQKARRLALAFSGQGGQWWAMSRALLKSEPSYRDSVEEFDAVLRPIAGWSVVEEMLRDEDKTRINDADVTQGSIFANQISLTKMWMARGLTPELIVGHSFGEVATSYITGAISMETAARIICARGQIPHNSSRRGAMAVIGLTLEQLEPLMPADGSAVIGAYNGPAAQTITGMEPSVVAVLAEVNRLFPDALARRLTMDFGWHSEHLDDCEAEFRKALGPVEWTTPSLPVVSTVTGLLHTKFDLDYWWRNLREPVAFKKAIDFCLDLGIDSFLEIGPHHTLTPLIRGIAQDRGKSVAAIGTLMRGDDDFLSISKAAANLHVAGVPIDWKVFTSGTLRERAPFPAHPWAKEKFNHLPLESRQVLFAVSGHPLLGQREMGPEPSWSNEICLKSHKYLNDHRVSGDCLFPAAGYVEIMVAALRELHGAGSVELRDVRFLEALSIGVDDAILLRTSIDPINSRIKIYSQLRDSEEGWRLRSEAYGWRHDFTLRPSTIDFGVMAADPAISRGEFYQLTGRHSLDYGPTFRNIDKLWVVNDTTALAHMDMGDVPAKGFIAFPGLLDSVLQSGIAINDMDTGVWRPGEPLDELVENDDRYKLKLPIGARKILVMDVLPTEIVTTFTADRKDFAGEYRVFGSDGTPYLAIEGFTTKALGSSQRASGSQSSATFYEEVFEPVEGGVDRLKGSLPSDIAARWLVIADEDPEFTSLVEGLTERGVAVERMGSEAFASMNTPAVTKAIETHQAMAGGLSGILFAVGATSHFGSEETIETAQLLAPLEKATIGLVTLGQALDRLRAAPSRPKVVVMTRNAQRVPVDGPMRLDGVVSSALVGLTRTLINECPEFVIKQIDVDQEALQQGASIADLVLGASPEIEVVLRGDQDFVGRVERRDPTALAPAKRVIDTSSDDSNYVVTMSAPGVIDNIVIREAAMPEPKADEVIVSIAAVGLNFRDVMAATSILPDETDGEDAWWRNLGLEFAGTVRAIGHEVEGVAIGDRVMGMGKGLMRRYAAVPASALMPVPDGVDLVAAATMPVGLMTAHYALDWIGRLKKGEKVLIHLATGGVGLAAIQVARDLGAEILATAGSDHKRRYLHDLGIEHVMNSRTLEFSGEIRTITKGRGVDVVLNALSGTGIDKGLECLAPFGRFVEIGKRDLAQDKPVGLKSLYYNNSYSVVDLSTLGGERPDLLRKLLDEISVKALDGTYKPIASTIFPASKAAEAMSLLSKAQHIGKVVVSFDESAVEVELDLTKPFALSADASYLVTGGLRGFGVSVAEWMSLCGAGRLLLAGRNGHIAEDVQPAIDAMRARGTEVVPLSLDVTDPVAVAALVAEHGHSDKPLRGIIHGAAVIEDGFLPQLDRGQIERVIRPKVAGAWNLHRAVIDEGLTLDFFTSFSSVAQVIGSSGQGNYTAANSVLNAIAGFQRSRGLPGVSVAWGAIGGSGFVSRSEALTNYLDSTGIKSIPDTLAAASLGYALRNANELLMYAGVDWAMVARTVPSAPANPRMKSLFARRVAGNSRLQAELVTSPRSAWDALLSDLIRTEVAKVLKVKPSEIPSDRKLSELGLDSLSSFELKNRIEAQIDINIPVAKFLQTPTVAGLSVVVANAFEAVLASRAAAEARKNSESTMAGADRASLRPLARQLLELGRPSAPMTSPLAAAEIRHAELTVDQPHEALSAALAKMGLLHDAIALHGRRQADGTLVLELGDVPGLEAIASMEELADPGQEGPLWRFGLRRDENDHGVLIAKAHRAAADAVSPLLALRAIVAAAMEETVEPPVSSFSDLVTSSRGAEGSPEMIRHQSFWTAILEDAPPLLIMPHRARAAAPAGLGQNRGPVGIATVSLDIPGLSELAAAGQEALFVSAFARSLSQALNAPSIVIERHDPSRRALAPGVIGPVADSVPVLLHNLGDGPAETLRRARHALDVALRHRLYDTAEIEAALESFLRAGNIHLRQVGFALLDPTGLSSTAEPFDIVHQLSEPSNEVRLDVVATGEVAHLALSVDSDVVDRAFAESLLQRMAAELSLLLDGASLKAIGPVGWVDPVSSRVPAAAPVPASGPRDMAASPAKAREIRLSTKQVWLLRSLQSAHVSKSYDLFWCISRAIRVRPSIDISRLGRAYQTVVERHEALRTRFEMAGDQFRAFVEAGPRSPMIVEDLGDADDAALMRRLDQLGEETIDPLADPLFQLRVLRSADSDVIHINAHHTIVDGWSLGLIVEEMLSAFIGMSLPPVEIGIEEALPLFDKATTPAGLAAAEAYLRQLYREPLPPLPKIGRTARGLPSNRRLVESGYAGEFVAATTPAGRQRLQDRVRSSGITESALLIASVAQAIAHKAQVAEVIMSVPTAMRTDRRMTNFVGYVADLALLRADTQKFASVDALAVDLKNQLDAAMEVMSFHSLMQGPFAEEIFAAGSYMARFNAGMQTAEKWATGASSSPLQRLGGTDEIDFGIVKVSSIGPTQIRSHTMYELDVRSFQGADGLSYRLGYDSVSFSPAEALEIFEDVLDRMNLTGDAIKPIVATSEPT